MKKNSKKVAAIGKRIAELLKIKGFKQVWLAKKLGVNEGVISRWKTGVGDPFNHIEEICALLQADQYWLLTGKTVENSGLAQKHEQTGLDGVRIDLGGPIHRTPEEAMLTRKYIEILEGNRMLLKEIASARAEISELRSELEKSRNRQQSGLERG